MTAPLLSLPTGPVDPLLMLLPALLIAAPVALIGYAILKKRMK